MARVILGFAGPIASGKGTCGLHLIEKHHGEAFRFSTALFDIARRLSLPETRDTFQRLSLLLRNEFGGDILAKAVVADAARSTAPLVVIDGMRRREDLAAFIHLPEFRLIYIDAPMETRYVRMKTRGEKADDATKTWEEFVADHEREAELEIPLLKEHAAEIIDNSGTKDALFDRIDAIVAKCGAGSCS